MYKIGVIARPDISTGNNNVWLINDEIKNVIIKYNSIPSIIIPMTDLFPGKTSTKNFDILKTQLKECDGFIFQGGDNYNDTDLQIINYCYKNNIPTLGICLGMQTMGCYLGNKLDYVNTNIDHQQKGVNYVHLVNVDNNSKLFNIIRETEIKVNSRHKECLIYNDLYVCARASDDIIEAIEVKELDFFIGVQWHPESMIEYDTVSRRLFEEFFKEVGKQYENRKIVRGSKVKENIQWN